MGPLNTSHSFLATFGLVLLAIFGLFAVDTSLARVERIETRAEAERLFKQALRDIHSGANQRAISSLKDAMMIERDNIEYQLTLSRAQMAAGLNSDAESTLNAILQKDSADGLANLLMARVLVKEGRIPNGISFYHRAIYGHWKDDPAGNRLRARFELIDLLAQQSDKGELLAELLPVAGLAPHDAGSRAKLGRLFLAAGSPPRAADVFLALVHDRPLDAAAHEGLGEAEFDRANYRAARSYFQAALRLQPADSAARGYLDLCNELLALDPTGRGLAPEERYRRSLNVLALALEDATQCLDSPPPDGAQLVIDKAKAALKQRVPPGRQVEVAEAGLDIAEQLWQARKKDCKAPPSPTSPLALILNKVAQ